MLHNPLHADDILEQAVVNYWIQSLVNLANLRSSCLVPRLSNCTVALQFSSLPSILRMVPNPNRSCLIRSPTETPYLLLVVTDSVWLAVVELKGLSLYLSGLSVPGDCGFGLSTYSLSASTLSCFRGNKAADDSKRLSNRAGFRLEV